MVIGFQQTAASSKREIEIDGVDFVQARRCLRVGMGCSFFSVINGGVGFADYNWFRIYHMAEKRPWT